MQVKVVFLLALLSAACLGQPQELLDDIYDFLEIKDPRFHELIELSARAKEELKCSYNVLPRRKLTNRELVFDSGYENCGWELKAVYARCVGPALFDLQFMLKKSLFNREAKRTTPLEHADSDRTIEVPEGATVKQVRLGFSKDKGIEILSKLTLVFEQHGERSIECAAPHKHKTVTLAANQRVSGFRMSHLNSQITNLDLYINKLKLKRKHPQHGQSWSYNELLRRFKLDRTRIEDKFFKRGPFGNSVGRQFEDPKFYGDWLAQAINVELAPDRSIASIQMKLINTLFYYEVLTPLRGNKNPVESATTTIYIPENAYVAWINMDLTPGNKRLRGLQFSFSDGSSSPCIGFCLPAAQRNATNSMDVYFTNKEYLIGFHGFETDRTLESLGFVISVERTENLAQYV